MVKSKCISVIIPCYNEQDNIEISYNQVSTYLDNHGFNYQIIFVNDGSTDNTLKILQHIQKEYFGVNIITYDKNVGKGYAVYRGLNDAVYKTKLILDCDLSVCISELYKLNWNWVRNQPIIKGQRIQVIRQPLYRIILGKIFKMITYLLTGLNYDTQCPFTILNLDKEFYSNLKINGFAFDVEILLKAKNQEEPVYLFNVDYYNQRKSTVTFSKIIKMLFELIKIRSKN